MSISIEVVTVASDDIVAAIAGLVPQLSSTSVPTVRQIRAVVAAPGVTVLLARNDAGEVVGMLTLVMYPLLTGLRARIEDVVVDAAARGQGVAARLTEHALERAQRAGARTVDLTSRPTREAANRLYERLGFAVRDSVVRRYTFADDPA